MKYAMCLGGLLGFVVIFATSLVAGKPPVDSLVHASIGSIVIGLLFRWVSLIWIRNVKQMLMEKQQAAVAAIAEAEERKRQEAKNPVVKPA
ncbi:MAG: hypothetical protein HN457_17090 [Opitutales bacterium]|jgi:uncharacterized membrane protein YjfL (UPF0719 family)|nr:hypothetical protein [Opitutales bacterium]MDG2253992.1 hypothetical protein [Opitutaceae bacterium]MBT5168833.1 hypothetical protein [Opitutales bacterium]MBT5813606.1 hypothetical protein [Opitutales bacterium]MBT6379545.1 hypothetical protein [Opitutales bacterium]